MAIPSSGNISIKSAAGSGRSIDAENTAVSSGSLVSLSQNAIEGLSTLNEAPYAMSEFYSYSHLWETTGTVVRFTEPKNVERFKLNLVDTTPGTGGTIVNLFTYRTGGELIIQWSGSLNTDWTTMYIGSSSSSYTTLSRTSDFGSSGVYHFTGSSSFGALGDGPDGDSDTSPHYITNTDGASMYFRLL